jgi:type I restriction enzyme R subunit
MTTGSYGSTFLDYTGAATRLFADPAFDGEPVQLTEEEIQEDGETRVVTETESEQPITATEAPTIHEPPEAEHRKFYFDGGQVEVAAHLVYELDPNGKKLRVIRYTDYAAETVRTLFPSARELRARWANADERNEIITALNERGISFEHLAETAQQPDADPFDLLCHLAFNVPLRTRRERAQRMRQNHQEFFSRYSPEARQILDDLIEKYAEYGDAQFVLPDVLKVPPVSCHGQPGEIIRLFGGPDPLRKAVNELQEHLYGA